MLEGYICFSNISKFYFIFGYKYICIKLTFHSSVRLKMAAPCATFRCLLGPWGRLALLRQAAAGSLRFYGVRAAATGELVTHTGQVRGCGGGSGGSRLRAGNCPLGSRLCAGSAGLSRTWSRAGSS